MNQILNSNQNGRYFHPSSTCLFNLDCGGEINVESGQLQSPNYPKSYPNDKNCEWIITAPIGFYVSLKFDTFDVRYMFRQFSTYTVLLFVTKTTKSRILFHPIFSPFFHKFFSVWGIKKENKLFIGPKFVFSHFWTN